jgi:hypothetical protein
VLVPRLVSPADGAQVVSLAPLLTWKPVISGSYQIQLSVDPSFTKPFVSTTSIQAPLPAQATFVLGSDLDVATVFYWRVGLYQSGSYRFSPSASFMTPQKNPAGRLPPPTLLAPPNLARLATSDVTLSWQSVPGALYYRIVVDTPYGTQLLSSIRDASMTTLPVTGLAPGTTYTWEVKTLNQFGWGYYQTPWSFTTP